MQKYGILTRLLKKNIIHIQPDYNKCNVHDVHKSTERSANRSFLSAYWLSMIGCQSCYFLSPVAPKVLEGRYWNAPTRPSVTFSFRTVIRKCMAVFSRNYAGTCTMSWGVLYSFLILMEGCLKFLCIFERLKNAPSLTVCSTFRFCTVTQIRIAVFSWNFAWCCLIFLWIFWNIEKVSPSLTMWLNGRWFLQIVDRDF